MKKRKALVSALVLCSLLTGCGGEKTTTQKEMSDGSATSITESKNVDDSFSVNDENVSDELGEATIGQFLKDKESLMFLKTGVGSGKFSRTEKVSYVIHFKDGKAEFFNITAPSDDEYHTIGEFAKMTDEEILELCRTEYEKYLDAKIDYTSAVLESNVFEDEMMKPIYDEYKKYYDRLIEYRQQKQFFSDFTISAKRDDTGNATLSEELRLSTVNREPVTKFDKWKGYGDRGYNIPDKNLYGDNGKYSDPYEDYKYSADELIKKVFGNDEGEFIDSHGNAEDFYGVIFGDIWKFKKDQQIYDSYYCTCGYDDDWNIAIRTGTAIHLDDLNSVYVDEVKDDGVTYIDVYGEECQDYIYYKDNGYKSK